MKLGKALAVIFGSVVSTAASIASPIEPCSPPSAAEAVEAVEKRFEQQVKTMVDAQKLQDKERRQKAESLNNKRLPETTQK